MRGSRTCSKARPGGRQGYTATEVLEFAENSHSFDGIIAATGESVRYRHGEGTEQLRGALVTPGTFEFFGMPALHGRVMQPGDYEPGAPPVFVMRHKTWMTRFNGDLSLLNKTFVLNGTGRTLVGIMPPRFAWYGADLWIPEKLRPEATSGFADAPPRWFMLGRLKPGLSTQQAEADLTVIARRLAKSYPQNYPAHFTVQVRNAARRGGEPLCALEGDVVHGAGRSGIATADRLQQRGTPDARAGDGAREGVRLARGAGSRARETRPAA